MNMDIHGYSSVKELTENVNRLYNSGLLNYTGGFVAKELGVPILGRTASSRPDEMLGAAVALGADSEVIKRLRAAIAAERIGFDPTGLKSILEMYKLDSEEKNYFLDIITKHEERFGKTYDQSKDAVIRPNELNVKNIVQLVRG